MTCDTVKSICDDTLQQFSISEHVGIRLFITCPPSSVRAACRPSGECVSRHRFVCLCSFWMSLVSVTASQRGELPYSDPHPDHVTLPQRNQIRPGGVKLKLVCRADDVFIGTFPANICCGWATSPPVFVETLSFFKLQWWRCGNPRIVPNVSTAQTDWTVYKLVLTVWTKLPQIEYTHYEINWQNGTKRFVWNEVNWPS